MPTQNPFSAGADHFGTSPKQAPEPNGVGNPSDLPHDVTDRFYPSPCGFRPRLSFLNAAINQLSSSPHLCVRFLFFALHQPSFLPRLRRLTSPRHNSHTHTSLALIPLALTHCTCGAWGTTASAGSSWAPGFAGVLLAAVICNRAVEFVRIGGGAAFVFCNQRVQLPTLGMAVLLGFVIMACSLRALKMVLLWGLAVQAPSSRALGMALLLDWVSRRAVRGRGDSAAATSCPVLSCHVMLCPVMSGRVRRVASRRVVSRRVVSRHAALRYIAMMPLTRTQLTLIPLIQQPLALAPLLSCARVVLSSAPQFSVFFFFFQISQ